ncbi:MAG: ABC transporter permease subunit [Alphaproteobacteria bacterium]
MNEATVNLGNQKVSRKLQIKGILEVLGILPVLILLYLFFYYLSPDRFGTMNNFWNILRTASTYNIVLAAGMTFVILTGGIDLSVGSVLGATAVVAVVVSLIPSMGWAAIPAALLVGLLIGAFHGSMVAYLGMPPFIVTLGSLSIWRGAAYLFADGTSQINNNLPYAFLGNASIGPIPVLVIIAFSVVLIAWFVLRRTVLGNWIYAVGGNPTAARLTGIPVKFVLIFAYSVCGLMAALGGVLQSSRLYSANGKLGEAYELDAIAAVILGGTSFVGGQGSVIGTLFGALIIAVLNNGLTILQVSYFWQLVIKGLVIIIAVLIDRLRGRKAGT